MEDDTTWNQKLQALTHIVTSPTTSPSLFSQFFVSSQIPCYLNWDYPPVLCTKSPSLHLRWAFSLFLRRVSKFGLPETSWRCKCPFQQPPPLTLARGLQAAAEWGVGGEKRREYVRMRLRRKRLFSNVNPMVPLLVPNLLMLCLLLWNPFPSSGS